LCFLTLAVFAAVVVLQDVSTFLSRLRAGAGGSGRWRPAVGALGLLPAVAFALGIVVQAKMVSGVRLRVDLLGSMLVGGMAVLLALNAWWVHRTLKPWYGLAPLLIFVAAGTCVGVDRLAHRWHTGFAANYDRMLARGLFRHLNETTPRGTMICVLDLRAYPFFGSARQFRVCQPQVMGDYSWWVTYLRERPVRLLAARYEASFDHRGWMRTRVWVVDRPEMFVRLEPPAGRWSFFVYQVQREQAELIR
jgi:hypothetical protein